jgi:hypothetical protein
MPAKAGIQSVLFHLKFLDSRFRGNDEKKAFPGFLPEHQVFNGFICSDFLAQLHPVVN